VTSSRDRGGGGGGERKESARRSSDGGRAGAALMTAAVSAVRPTRESHARTHAHCAVCTTTRETRAYIAGKDKQTEAAANGATEPPIRRPAFFAWCRQADQVGRSFHELSAALYLYRTQTTNHIYKLPFGRRQRPPVSGGL